MRHYTRDMKEPAPPGKLHRTVLRASLWGSLVFAALTLGFVLAADVGMHGRSGELRPDALLGLLFLVWTPALAVKQVLGLSGAPASSFVSGTTFGVLVTGLLGAVIFGAASLLCHALREGLGKDNNEN